MGLGSAFKSVTKGATGLVGGFTGYGGASAAGKAADAQTKGMRQGIEALNKTYADQRALLDPQLALGNKALTAYGNLLGIGTANGLPDYSGFQNQPGYKFMQEEGENALARMQSARGNLFSGGAGRELMRYNTGLADQTYNQYADRLGAFSSLGPQTANLLSGYRGQLGSGLASLYTGIGDARAAGKIGASNSYSNAAANLLNFGSSFFGGGGAGATGNNAPTGATPWNLSF
jgi:hypothetical protein